MRGDELLDAKFADDTSLYLQGHEANLIRAEGAIETFCTASGALINWQKTIAFWISESPNSGVDASSWF